MVDSSILYLSVPYHHPLLVRPLDSPLPSAFRAVPVILIYVYLLVDLNNNEECWNDAEREGEQGVQRTRMSRGARRVGCQELEFRIMSN
eukprot:3137005-Pleurochrysis_carterae.AAC.1